MDGYGYKYSTIILLNLLRQCCCFAPSSEPNNNLTALSLSSTTGREGEKLKAERWMREGVSREQEAVEAGAREIYD